MRRTRTDETGKRFGQMVVLGILEIPPSTPTRYRVRCDCGRESDVQRSNLLGGQRSCGCQGAPNLRNRRKVERDPNRRIAPPKRTVPCICEVCNAPFLATRQNELEPSDSFWLVIFTHRLENLGLTLADVALTGMKIKNCW